MSHTVDKSQEKRNNFALYFLFPEAVVFDKEKLIKKISSVSDKTVEINPISGFDGKETKTFARVMVEGQAFEIAGLDAPLPKNIVDYTVGCAYGMPEEIEQMRNHQYHMIVFYRGESKDPMVIFNAYKKLAYGFVEQGLLCMANPYSWNVVGANLITGMLEDKETKEFAETPAMMIWRSFIKMPHNDGVWFVTKGNNLFNVTEYAYFGQMEEGQEVYDIFENIFTYVYENGVTISEGDTIQIEEDVYIRFKAVTKLQEQLNGETLGTLVLEKISAEEINE